LNPCDEEEEGLPIVGRKKVVDEEELISEQLKEDKLSYPQKPPRLQANKAYRTSY
jgi:hypothetical protein